MAYKKDIKPWLKANNLTWEKMDEIWEEACALNTKCKALKNSGLNWSDLNMNLINSLLTVKEDTLRYQEEKRLKEEQEEERKRKEAEDKKYFSEHFEEIMLKRIESGEGIEERYLRELISEYSIKDSYGEDGRWTRSVCTVFELKGRYFRVNWRQGLTEYQENEYPYQPVEVFKNCCLKIRIEDSWSETETKTIVDTDTCVCELKSMLDSVTCINIVNTSKSILK